jgi:hypothetical protein
VFSYKGSVLTYDVLPLNAKIGDVYNIENEFTITSTNLIGDPITKEYLAGTNVAWNGESWDPLAGSIDLSEYATKLTVEELQEKVITLQTTLELVAGDGLKKDLNTLSVKLDENPNNKLTITDGGLSVDIS